jgi:hypothetical protein
MPVRNSTLLRPRLVNCSTDDKFLAYRLIPTFTEILKEMWNSTWLISKIKLNMQIKRLNYLYFGKLRSLGLCG